jgi:tellurite resistance protein
MRLVPTTETGFSKEISMPERPLHPDAVDLEAAFFAQENERLLKRLREKAEREEQREALREVLKSDDEEHLEHLLDLGVRAETALAVTLIPLAVVAWADGKLEDREREAITKAAEERGIEPGSPAHQLLDTWLSKKPTARLVEMWKQYVRTIFAQFDETEQKNAKEEMLGTARAVAEASGGFLGLTSKISAAEKAALEDLESTFD